MKGRIKLNQYTIGLPRALLYYRYHDLWTTFFKTLGCKVIISDKSNQKILDDGIKHSVDEACLSLKLYLGHIENLKDRCDYILVPRIICLKKHQKLCTNFSALYDIVHNIFPKLNILNYNIDVNNKETELYAFIKMGRQLGFSYLDSLRSYQEAKRIEEQKQKIRQIKQKQLLQHNNIKILLVSHAYNLYDALIGERIISFLKENNVTPIMADIYDKNHLKEEYQVISKHNYWTYQQELLGAITHYKQQVDGIILLTTFPCGPDSLSNEMCIRKINNIPIIQIIIDELKEDAGIITRLESFLDILVERKKRRIINETAKNH